MWAGVVDCWGSGGVGWAGSVCLDVCCWMCAGVQHRVVSLSSASIAYQIGVWGRVGVVLLSGGDCGIGPWAQL